jgi:iron complex outermembrane receptor protein
MKQGIILLKGLIFICMNIFYAKGEIISNNYLEGRVTDKISGNPLYGVTIYIPDLKTGTVTDTAGFFRINNLPDRIIHLQVSYLGYRLIEAEADLSVTNEIDLLLEPAVSELHEIVVTGLSGSTHKNRTPAPISTIPKIQIQQVVTSNIIDAISTQPGISQVTTGAGISKPLIRGLGYSRIVVVNDGIRQEGQQWGDEHGIEIDEYGINKVEILKGPASLSYGSDAMAGVINFISAPTLPEGVINGSVLLNYQTNNGLAGGSVNLAGNRKGFIWDLRYSNKAAHSYKNKTDNYVFNSAFRENNSGGILGINRPWGYSHLHFGFYNFSTGIVEGHRDSLSGKFLKPVNDNGTVEYIEANQADLNSYSLFIPYQKVRHYKAVLNNSHIIGNGSLKTIIGWQQNRRQEFSDIINAESFGLYFLLNTFNYDVNYNITLNNKLNISFGVNGMQQQSENKGNEFLIPEYSMFDIGGYIIGKKSLNKFDFSGGIRIDFRSQTIKEFENRFKYLDKNFSGLSGSAGVTYQISEILYTKVNLSRGYRAPNISELSSNGIHEGTARFENGNPDLKPEKSLQTDFAFGINSEHVTGEINYFYNNIDNFIYARKLFNVNNSDSVTDGHSAFMYFAGNANLTGGEITLDIHPHPYDWLHFENSFSYVLATQTSQPDSTKYLPFIPPGKFTSEIRADAKKLSKYLSNSYVKLTGEFYLKQNKIFGAYNTETITPDYVLFNLGIGTDITSRNKTLFSIYAGINNLTDVSYQSHLSRLKYNGINNLTGRTGVYNMGRNISLKVIVPFK